MFQRKFRFPGSLFPLYYETLIGGTRPVIFLPRESRKTRHFYATQCEVYLERISILHKSKLYVYVYVYVALDIIHIIQQQEFSTNDESFLLNNIQYLYVIR